MASISQQITKSESQTCTLVCHQLFLDKFSLAQLVTLRISMIALCTSEPASPLRYQRFLYRQACYLAISRHHVVRQSSQTFEFSSFDKKVFGKTIKTHNISINFRHKILSLLIFKNQFKRISTTPIPKEAYNFPYLQMRRENQPLSKKHLMIVIL